MFVHHIHVPRGVAERDVFSCHPFVQTTHLSDSVRRSTLPIRMVNSYVDIFKTQERTLLYVYYEHSTL